jgi:Calcium binding
MHSTSLEEADLGARKAVKKRSARKHARIRARLDEMIEEATVDAYGESEQVAGFYTLISEHLTVPFETTVLGVPVTARRLDVTERDEIVVICTRGGLRQPIPILDLPLPSPPPAGAEWIAAYRHWARRS